MEGDDDFNTDSEDGSSSDDEVKSLKKRGNDTASLLYLDTTDSSTPASTNERPFRESNVTPSERTPQSSSDDCHLDSLGAPSLLVERLLELFHDSRFLNKSCADCQTTLLANNTGNNNVYCSFYKKLVFRSVRKKKKKNENIEGKAHSSLSMYTSLLTEDGSGDDEDTRNVKDENTHESDKKMDTTNGEGGLQLVSPEMRTSPSKMRLAEFSSAHTAFSPPGVPPPPLSIEFSSLSLMKKLPFNPGRFSVPPHGVFVCSECAFAHSSLGTDIAHVKNLHSHAWTEGETRVMEGAGGNAFGRAVYERYMPAAWGRGSVPLEIRTPRWRELFARAKYQSLAFVFPHGPLCDLSWGGITSPEKRVGAVAGGSSAAPVETIAKPMTGSDNLIHWFCVVGTDKTVEKDNGRASHVQLHGAVLDTYPSKDFYPDTPFPCQLPIFAFPTGCRPSAQQKSPHLFTFCLTNEVGVKLYASALQVYDERMELEKILEMVRMAGYEGELSPNTPHSPTHPPKANMSVASSKTFKSKIPQMLYLPKCLIILSAYPMYNVHRKFLTQLYRISLNHSPLPLERYVANFCAEIPVPPRGKIEVQFTYIPEEASISIARPAQNRLPLVGFSFRPLFSCLSVGNILVVFGYLLTETRVVIVSKFASMLGSVGDALLSLLFPFSWQGIYIPLLPQHMHEILEAPVPFLVGLNSKYLVDMPPAERPTGVVFVDLDRDEVHLGFQEGDGLTSFGRNVPSFPDRPLHKLKNKLESKGSGVYLSTPSQIKGRVTNGFDERLRNKDREAYAHEIVGDPNEDSKQRLKVLTMAERAFPNGEHRAPVEVWVGDGGKINQVKGVEDDKRKKRMWRKDSKGKKENGNDGSKLHTHDARNDEELISLLDQSADESEAFSANQIRDAFLRFFVMTFKNYHKFVETDPKKHAQLQHQLFHRNMFLQSTEITKDNQREFLRSIISTQMFESFVGEKIRLGEEGQCVSSDIMIFDELIIAYKNTKKSKLKREDTPFLTDDSNLVTEIYTPPKPSHWGLPDDGRTYKYKYFPKFDTQLFGSTRPPKQWEQHQIPSSNKPVLKKQHNASEDKNSILFKIMPPHLPQKEAPPKDLQWALYLLVYKNAYTDISARHNEDKRLRDKDMEGLIKFSKFTASMLPKANMIIGYTRRTHGSWLFSLARLQALHRMVPQRNRFRELRNSAIYLQRWFRRLRQTRERAGMTGLYFHARKIQTVARRKMARSEAGHRRAARTLQLAARARLAARTLQRRKSAIIMQAVVRGCEGRRLSLERGRRIGILRGFIAGRVKRVRYLRFRHGVLLLQARIRGRKMRFLYLLLRAVISKTQARIRGWRTRRAVSKSRRDRTIMYRKQMLELWRRAFVPLIYRARFWMLLNGNGFLHLALHEEELARLWWILGVSGARRKEAGGTVLDKFQKVQAKLMSVKDKKSNNLVPVFPAEIDAQKPSTSPRGDFLLSYKVKVEEERKNYYEKLKRHLDQVTLERIFQLFNLAMNEEKKKERIITSLWEYRGLAKQSAIFVLKMNGEESSVHDNKSSNRKVKKVSSPFVQDKLEQRIRADLLATAQACLFVMHSFRGLPSKYDGKDNMMVSPQGRAILYRIPGNTLQLKRYNLLRMYVLGGSLSKVTNDRIEKV